MYHRCIQASSPDRYTDMFREGETSPASGERRGQRYRGEAEGDRYYNCQDGYNVLRIVYTYLSNSILVLHSHNDISTPPRFRFPGMYRLRSPTKLCDIDDGTVEQ